MQPLGTSPGCPSLCVSWSPALGEQDSASGHNGHAGWCSKYKCLCKYPLLSRCLGGAKLILKGPGTLEPFLTVFWKLSSDLAAFLTCVFSGEQANNSLGCFGFLLSLVFLRQGFHVAQVVIELVIQPKMTLNS